MKAHRPRQYTPETLPDQTPIEFLDHDLPDTWTTTRSPDGIIAHERFCRLLVVSMRNGGEQRMSIARKLWYPDTLDVADAVNTFNPPRTAPLVIITEHGGMHIVQLVFERNGPPVNDRKFARDLHDALEPLFPLVRHPVPDTKLFSEEIVIEPPDGWYRVRGGGGASTLYTRPDGLIVIPYKVPCDAISYKLVVSVSADEREPNAQEMADALGAFGAQDAEPELIEKRGPCEGRHIVATTYRVPIKLAANDVAPARPTPVRKLSTQRGPFRSN